MEWAIITMYTSKCAQMDPLELLNRSKFYSRCKKCDIEKTIGASTPSGGLKVKIFTISESRSTREYDQ